MGRISTENISKKWKILGPAQTTIREPHSTTQFTTTSPQKHHPKTSIFPAPPSKNAHKAPKTTLSRRPEFFLK
jgi:hypothetical protein